MKSAIPGDPARLMQLWRGDLARYEFNASLARKLFPEDHPLVQMWVRRARTVTRAIELFEAKPAWAERTLSEYRDR